MIKSVVVTIPTNKSPSQTGKAWNSFDDNISAETAAEIVIQELRVNGDILID